MSILPPPLFFFFSVHKLNNFRRILLTFNSSVYNNLRFNIIFWFLSPVRPDGLYLMEVDRVLRPGGYWILSGPPIRWKKYWRGWERTAEDLKQEQDAIEEVARRICWMKVVEKDDLAIWQKPFNHKECVKGRKIFDTPHFCRDTDPDSAW